MELTLTDADLARLEELAGKVCLPFETVMEFGVGCPSGNGPIPLKVCMTDDKNDAAYIAAACNAAPALVDGLRKLRAEVEHMKHGMEAAYMSGRAGTRQEAEDENAALREKVEALEWLVECIDNYEWNSNRSGWFVAQGVAKEAKATMQAAREAMK